MHFGFRARDESRKLRWGDVELQNDPEDNREMLVWLAERGTKTRSGQEQGHQRAFQPKLYATNFDRCIPVEFHRPVEMNKPDLPFYSAVKHNCRANDQIWYEKSPLGKNEIGNFLSTAAKKANLQQGQVAKITNHSVRKTSISRLLDADIPENYVAQLSGHKSIDSLQSY
jgi:integrase